MENHMNVASEDCQLSKLSHDYVFNHIFRKLALTCVKYRDLIPAVEDLDNDLNILKEDEVYPFTLEVIDVLMTHAERSNAVKEILDNVRRDFWHGIDPAYAEHKGPFYISSVTDTLRDTV